MNQTDLNKKIYLKLKKESTFIYCNQAVVLILMMFKDSSLEVSIHDSGSIENT